MEINQVKYFIIAAQTENLTKAAKRLNITQSALSKSISNLEGELGFQLFDRAGKRVSLNESGRKFMEHAIYSVQELDVGVTAARIRQDRAMLHIGLLHYSERFMQCLKAYSEADPSTIIQLDHLEMATLSIDTNEYDALIFPQSPMSRKYKARMIFSDTYFLAVHKSHELAGCEAVRVRDLPSQRLIFIKLKDEQLDLPYHLCTSLGVEVNDDFFTNSYEIQRWFISNDSGIGFVPHGSAGTYISDPNIVLLPILDEGFDQEIMIGFKREKHLSEIGKRFAEFVREYFSL